MCVQYICLACYERTMLKISDGSVHQHASVSWLDVDQAFGKDLCE